MSAVLDASLPPLTPGQAAALDDDTAFSDCTRWHTLPSGEREAQSVFALQGLHCAACADVIEAALAGIPGVSLAQVNAASRRLRVHWDPQRTRPALLVDAVQRAGYQALPTRGDEARSVAQQAARRALWRLFVAAFCMMQVMMLTAPIYLAAPGEIAPDLLALLRRSAWLLSLPVVMFSAGPFFAGAWRALRQRRIGMDVPVALGIAITFIAGTGATFDPAGPFGSDPYLDSMTMFVAFLLVARWLEVKARARSTEALDGLLQRLPESAERLDASGQPERVAVARLLVGDRVRVAVGEAFPGDGVVLEGHTQVDEAMLSGESRPQERAAGDAVLAGSINLGGPALVRLQKVGDATRYRQIVDLVQRTLAERPALLRAADRLAAPFLWGVLALAVLAGAVWMAIDPSRALSVAVSVLIVTCPCALSLAAPAALLSAASTLAGRGVLVQRLDALEPLARTDAACFDKTGTLTQDRLVLAQTVLDPLADRGALVARAAALAALSRHPLSGALVAALPPSQFGWSSVREVAGQGIEAADEAGRLWRLGSPSWVGMSAAAAARPVVAFGPVDASAAQFVRFEFDEALRPDAIAAIDALRRQGLSMKLLSGDAPASVQALAERVGIADVQGGATPEGKLGALRSLQEQGRVVLMVGDGINDGPVLARADVSFALGHGSALARQRADFIVLGSRLAEVPAARALARRTMRVVRQNFGWAVAYNAACVPLALAGLLPPWAAGSGMALSSLFVVLNAMRLTR